MMVAVLQIAVSGSVIPTVGMTGTALMDEATGQCDFAAFFALADLPTEKKTTGHHSPDLTDVETADLNAVCTPEPVRDAAQQIGPEFLLTLPAPLCPAIADGFSSANASLQHRVDTGNNASSTKAAEIRGQSEFSVAAGAIRTDAHRSIEAAENFSPSQLAVTENTSSGTIDARIGMEPVDRKTGITPEISTAVDTAAAPTDAPTDRTTDTITETTTELRKKNTTADRTHLNPVSGFDSNSSDLQNAELKDLVVSAPAKASKAGHSAQTSNLETAWRERLTNGPEQQAATHAKIDAPKNNGSELHGSERGKSATYTSPLVGATSADFTLPSDPSRAIHPVGLALKTNIHTTAPETVASRTQFSASDNASDGQLLVELVTDADDTLNQHVILPDMAAISLPDQLGPAGLRNSGDRQAITVPTGQPPTIAPKIVEMTKSGSHGPVEIVLSPEELGRLTISVTHDRDFVHVNVLADRAETMDLMRRHAGDLIADLKQAGFSGASLSFGHGSSGGQPKFAQVPVDVDARTASHQPTPDVRPFVPSQVNSKTGLDLRF